MNSENTAEIRLQNVPPKETGNLARNVSEVAIPSTTTPKTEFQLETTREAVVGLPTNTSHRTGELHQIMDLKEMYPITYRRAFKKAFWRFIVFAVIGLIYFLAERFYLGTEAAPENADTIRIVLKTLLTLSGVWWLWRVVYYTIERQFTEYRVDGGNLYLRRGLFVKETGSFPLSRITDIYLHRGWGDLFWGLSSLHVSTPTQSSGTFAYIHGLSIQHAETLQRHLQELVKQHDYQLQMITGHVGTIAASATPPRKPR